MNICMKAELRFVREARLTHALPAAPELMQPADAARAAPSAEDLERRRFQAAAVAASAFDSQPYVEDESGAGAADDDNSAPEVSRATGPGPSLAPYIVSCARREA
jgi:hypothetical protein